MKNKHLILMVLALIGLNSAMLAQQKYALLIAGDYKPGTEIPVNHKWNNGNDLDLDKGWDEFWNDTYLMWELLHDDPPATITISSSFNFCFKGFLAPSIAPSMHPH